MRLRFYFLLLICILFFSPYCDAQSYGLGFLSHEVKQDKRTSLDLNNGKELCFNSDFELSFDLSFLPNHDNYFGYVFRLIANGKQNIDLIYDRRLEAADKHFRIVVGDQFSKISFDIEKEKLLKSWNNIRLRFDFNQQKLILTAGGKSYSQPIRLEKGSCYKMLFGSNDDKEFRTTDVPPMKIRNIRILENDKPSYQWLLDEENGFLAKETVKKNSAVTKNPLWIKKLHQNWELEKTFKINGTVSLAFDAEQEKVYLVREDSLTSYSVPKMETSGLSYQSGKQHFMLSNQSVFDSEKQLIYNIDLIQKIVSTFDLKTGLWDRKVLNVDATWHFNKFYSAADSALYLIGGYSHFSYSNAVKRYHFSSKSWEDIKYSGSSFIPRYLSAMGTTKNGAYILGGYGSSSGQQMLNPKHIYDLVYFDIKTKTFKKIYDFNVKGEDFVFANSLIIKEKEQSFYGLRFDRNKFDSRLQMVQGSLEHPNLKMVGNTIPYQFHDIESFADLFYCPLSKEFVAVTLFQDKSLQTTVNIYTLHGPPLATSESTEKAGLNLLWLALALVVLLLMVLIWVYFIPKKSTVVIPETAVIQDPLTELTTQKTGTEELSVQLQEAYPTERPARVNLQEEKVTLKNLIFIFGDFQMFDKEGTEITNLFRPAIKELFLLILLYTFRSERGISSEKLKELLWFDKSVESARNNRSVSIIKLKSILEKMDNCQVAKEAGYWKINMNYDSVYVDYHNYQMIIKDKRQLNKQRITDLTDIVQRGCLLQNEEHEWLDPFKSEASNEVIAACLHFATSIKIEEDPEFLIKVTNYIAFFDAVNEEAMAIKCKALAFLGRHSLAKNTFEQFCKEYKAIYDEQFGKGFQEILE